MDDAGAYAVGCVGDCGSEGPTLAFIANGGTERCVLEEMRNHYMRSSHGSNFFLNCNFSCNF